jgi:23S rRNA pseudouridine1911/1915/1917 synthase
MNQHAKRRAQQGYWAGEPEAETAKPAAKQPLREPIAAGLQEFVIPEGHEPERLDKYLSNAAGLSRARIKALLDEGQVSLDGKPTDDASIKIRPGQKVSIEVPPPAAAEPQGEKIPLKIAYEDEHLIVVDKPAGLVVHPSAGHETGTLVNALIAHCGASLSGIGGVLRPGIVHRIDKDTSGLLVVAKTDAAHQGLSALFADHGRTMSLTREYQAFVWGAPRHRGTIETYIGRHQHQRERQVVTQDEQRGRLAITHYELETPFGKERDGKPMASLVRCALETGRTHQIRVHMAHIGHPLIGDQTYGSGFKTKIGLLPPKLQEFFRNFSRQALHAATLGFAHPVTGEELMFESDLPKDLKKLQAMLEKL